MRDFFYIPYLERRSKPKMGKCCLDPTLSSYTDTASIAHRSSSLGSSPELAKILFFRPKNGRSIHCSTNLVRSPSRSIGACQKSGWKAPNMTGFYRKSQLMVGLKFLEPLNTRISSNPWINGRERGGKAVGELGGDDRRGGRRVNHMKELLTFTGEEEGEGNSRKP